MDERLSKIMNRLKLDVSTVGCQLSGLNNKRSWMCTAVELRTGKKRFEKYVLFPRQICEIMFILFRRFLIEQINI